MKNTGLMKKQNILIIFYQNTYLVLGKALVHIIIYKY